jgi:hypothetical protein
MKKVKLFTTFALLKKAEACTGRYKKLAKSLGGIKSYGKDTPINLLDILEILNVDDCLWCLQATTESCNKIARLMAADFAESVLGIFEKEFPDDKRPRAAIQAARDFASGKITEKQLAAARNAARAAARAAERAAERSAAWAATWAAARNAAGAATWAAASAATGAAARDAEREKQEKTIRRYLSK